MLNYCIFAAKPPVGGDPVKMEREQKRQSWLGKKRLAVSIEIGAKYPPRK